METRPFLVNGAWRTGEGTQEVRNPYDDALVAELGVPTAADVEEAVAIADETQEENARLIAAEGGKPLKWARVEAARAVSTFRWASETLRHGQDEAMRLDTEAAFGSRFGILRRFPIGPVLGITPFNFPLNLVAHKVAPALAAGNSILVKPAPQTPLTALLLGEVALEAGLPPGALNILPCDNTVAEQLVVDPRFKLLS